MRAVAHLVVLAVHLEVDPLPDQLLAEDIARQQEIVILLQRLHGFAHRGRQLLDRGALRFAPGEDVGVDRAETAFGRVDLVADAVQPGQELPGQRQVDVAGGVGRAEFHAGGVRLVGVLGDAHRRAAVAQREEGIDRGLETRHQAAVGVGAGVGQRQQRRAVLEQPADVIQRLLAHAAVALRVVEDVGFRL